MKVFCCNKEHTSEDGQFPLSSLQAFSIATKCIVLIKGFAIIEEGDVRFIQ